jgi:plasmid stabilization system protein ParE
VGVVRYSKRAREDILDIWLWIARGSSVSIADDIVERIEHRATTLAHHLRWALPDQRLRLTLEAWSLSGG